MLYKLNYQDYLPKELAALVVNVSFNPRNCELMLNNKVSSSMLLLLQLLHCCLFVSAVPSRWSHILPSQPTLHIYIFFTHIFILSGFEPVDGQTGGQARSSVGQNRAQPQHVDIQPTRGMLEIPHIYCMMLFVVSLLLFMNQWNAVCASWIIIFWLLLWD